MLMCRTSAFLGLDNIGPIGRSAALPVAGVLEQSDGTAWMAMYCLKLLEIALVLARHDQPKPSAVSQTSRQPTSTNAGARLFLSAILPPRLSRCGHREGRAMAGLPCCHQPAAPTRSTSAAVTPNRSPGASTSPMPCSMASW